ncbi:MAG TPA: amidohydrolase family protein [Candidatus Limnocylindrales bacterium]
MARAGRIEVPVDPEVDSRGAGLLEERPGLGVDGLVREADGDPGPLADRDRLAVRRRLADLVVADVGGIDTAVLGDDPTHRTRIGAAIERQIAQTAATGGREYFSHTRTGRHIGRSISEIAAERGKGVGETAVELIVEESPDAVLVFRRGTSEADFDALARRTLAHPAFMVASDGLYHGALPHPRGYGCFAQVLGTFVRDRAFVSLERAVHLMSGLPAARFGIRDRGRIAEGLAADLVVFHPATVASRATWDEPRGTAVGVDAVVVNGAVVARDGRLTGEQPGRVVRAGSAH